MCVQFQLPIFGNSGDMKRVSNFTMGRQVSTQTSPSFWGQSLRAFGLTEEGPSCQCQKAREL